MRYLWNRAQGDSSCPRPQSARWKRPLYSWHGSATHQARVHLGPAPAGGFTGAPGDRRSARRARSRPARPRGCGCRRNEILTPRWEDVDLEHDGIRLRYAKTGGRAVPLSPTARRVLAALPRKTDNPWVIAGRGTGTHLANRSATWGVVRKNARLEDVRIHDLRHSYASRALSPGESLPMIGKLLGHWKVQTTARYAHLARDSVKAAAERVSDSLAAHLDTATNVSAAKQLLALVSFPERSPSEESGPGVDRDC